MKKGIIGIVILIAAMVILPVCAYEKGEVLLNKQIRVQSGDFYSWKEYFNEEKSVIKVSTIVHSGGEIAMLMVDSEDYSALLYGRLDEKDLIVALEFSGKKTKSVTLGEIGNYYLLYVNVGNNFIDLSTTVTFMGTSKAGLTTGITLGTLALAGVGVSVLYFTKWRK